MICDLKKCGGKVDELAHNWFIYNIGKLGVVLGKNVGFGVRTKFDPALLLSGGCGPGKLLNIPEPLFHYL